MAPRPYGTCKMCLLDKPLASSHLIPARVYKYCRKGEHGPIRIGRGIVLPTDEQTQTPLLCNDCEETLNTAGERWVVSRLLTWEKRFPLYDLLTQEKPDWDVDGMLTYCAVNNPWVKSEKLTHFALGIFWKASVHSWSRAEKEPRIDLGPYSDKLRMWLRGESRTLHDVYLVTIIGDPKRVKPFISEPYEAERSEWRTFNFCVPGLVFMLNVGKTVDEALQMLCIHHRPERPIIVADWLSDKFESVLAEQFHHARKTKPFLRWMDRIEQSRKRNR